METLEENTYRLSAPNLAEAFIAIRQDSTGGWVPVLRLTKDGPDVANSTAPLTTPQEAWDAAFEQYRQTVVT